MKGADDAVSVPRRALVLGAGEACAAFLRFCAALAWDGLVVQTTDDQPASAYADLDLTDVDMICIEDAREGAPAALDSVRRLHQRGALPPIVLFARGATEALQREARLAGAAAVVAPEAVTGRAFVDSVEELLAARAVARPAPLPALGRRISVASVATDSGGAASAPAVPGYTIQRLIGRGSSASVFLANAIDSTRPVALKVVRIDERPHPNAMRRFLREYELLSRTAHPHIVQIYERGVRQDLAYIAMEHCAAGDLRQLLGQGPLPPQQALQIVRQIALGLGAAHGFGIVHRDLKPANVLLRTPQSVALADFGIACDLGQTHHLTMVNAIVGSLHYVSPEMIRHDEVDQRADLYSAGVILYQLATGTTPYQEATISRMLEAHMSGVARRLPPAVAMLQPLVDGLLAKDREDRFQSVGELLGGIRWVADANGWPCDGP